MAIISLLTACFGGEDRAAVAIRKFESIPLLSGSALITSVNGIGGGSSETCYGGYVDTLYGTSKSRSEVLAFYREQARIENWGINEKSSSDSSLFAGDDNAYALSVVIMMPVGPTELYYSPYIPKKDIDEAFGKFSTIYVLHISYYPNFKNC
jgi:hypothetical protein